MLPDGEILGPWYKSENRTLDILAVSHVIVSSHELGRKTMADGQDISWSRPGLPVMLGTGCGATQDSLQLQLPVSVKTTAFRVVSALACATAIPDETEIMNLVTTDAHGRTHSYEFRAGRDTSEWAFDCPDVFPRMRHRKAAVTSSYPVERRGGRVCDGHAYVSTLRFAHEMDVSALQLTWTGPRAAISIQEITLHNAKSESLPPAPDLEGFLSASERWHLTEQPKEARVYKNSRAMPRAWLVPETLTLKPDQVLAALKWSRLPDGRPFDPARIGLVEEPLELKGGADATAEAAVQRITDTMVEVRTRSSTVSFLVLSDVYYPGWWVTVDDAPARLYQTDYVLRGVVVPAGEHLVRFKFTPRTFYAGLGISILCAAVTIGISAFGILEKRRRADNSRETAHAVER